MGCRLRASVTSSLIDDLLLLARSDADAHDLSFEILDFAEAVRDAGREARVLADVRGIELAAPGWGSPSRDAWPIAMAALSPPRARRERVRFFFCDCPFFHRLFRIGA